jgi:MFS transporter, UMF1 family
VADLTGNIRYAFLFLLFMFWVALPVLAGVDVERGRADARAWSSSHGDDGDEVEVDAVVIQDR